MSEPAEHSPPSEPPAAAPPAEASPAARMPKVDATESGAAKRRPKVRVETLKPVNEDDRRDFFGEAMREVLAPFTGLLERKINPLLAALEALPSDVDRFTNVTLPSIGKTLDQPLLGAPSGPANWPLGSASGDVSLTYLRPPGAMPPGEFESVCSRCRKCVEVCPASAIQMDMRQLTADGLPYIVAKEQACVVCDSLACMKECPTGALKLVDRLSIHMGTAKVDQGLCLRDNGEDCRLCVEACPITGEGAGGGLDAILIHAESGRVRVRKNVCVGCGLCESRCPTAPAAIRVAPFKGRVEPIIA